MSCGDSDGVVVIVIILYYRMGRQAYITLSPVVTQNVSKFYSKLAWTSTSRIR